MRAPKRPWIWIVGGTVLVVLALGGVYLSTQVGDLSWWPGEVEAFNLAHAVPEDENAGPLYLRSRVRVTGWTSKTLTTDWRLPVPAKDADSLQRDRDRLTATGLSEDQLEEASRRPTCFYPLDPDQDPRVQPFPYLNRDVQITRYLILGARVSASEGRPEAAMKSLLTASRLGAHHMRGFLITQIVGTACRDTTWPAFERLAMDAPPPPEILEAAADELDRLSAGMPLPKERWEAEHLLQRGYLESMFRPTGFTGADVLSTGTELSAWQSVLLWAKMAVLHPLPACRRELKEIQAIQAKGKPTPQDRARLKQLAAGGNPLTAGLLPALDKAEQSLVRERTRESGTRILLRLRAHRLRQGAYPESLDALRKDLPMDPYTGKPFLYKRLDGDRFLLYSTGPDGKDDGGARDSRELFRWPAGADLLFGRPPTP